jgi:hypothetical protein
MTTVYLVISLLMMVVGIIGALLPVIPALPLVYAGFFIYGLGTGWADYGWTVMIVGGLVTALAQLLDYVAGAIGAKRYGASKAGIWGSIIGGLVGVIFFNVVGLILGPFVGAMIGELVWGRNLRDATRSGWGAFLGFVATTLFKMAAGLAMLLAFLWLVLF